MTDETTSDKDVHTEVRPHDAAAIKAAKQAEAKRAAASLLPDPEPEDGLDDLFNDMPV